MNTQDPYSFIDEALSWGSRAIEEVKLKQQGVTPENLQSYRDEVFGKHRKEAKQSLISEFERVKKEAFKKGQRVGQYQAADKLYGHVTTMWLFKDNTDPKLNSPEKADNLLKDCEKYLNHNRKTYSEYLAQLSKEQNNE